jgi:hypothetical protein
MSFRSGCSWIVSMRATSSKARSPMPNPDICLRTYQPDIAGTGLRRLGTGDGNEMKSTGLAK